MDYSLQLQTIVGLLALAFLYNLWVSRTNNRKKSKIKEAPEPPGRLPLIGHLHLLRGREPLYQKLSSMADKYGPAFTLHVGARRFLIVSSWEVAKECFTTNDIVLAGRPTSAAVKYMAYNGAMVGFASYGPYWREIRKILTLELLSNRRLEALKSIRTTEINTCIKELYELGMENRRDPIIFDLKKWFRDSTFNVIVRLIAGKRHLSSTGAFDDSEGRRIADRFYQFHRLVEVMALSDVFPFLEWMDRLGGKAKDMKRNARELDSVAAKWLDEHRRRRRNSGKAEGDTDFIDVMLSVMENAEFSDYDPDTIIKANCLALILGGSHTSAKFLTGSLSFMLNSPHMLKKAQDELDIHVGNDRKVEESDIKNLVYLQAIVKESLRICSAASAFSIPHKAIEDCKVGGFHVAAGTEVLVNFSKIQRDPCLWPLEPCEFRPERFLSSHVDVDVRGQHFELIPFGAGRRMCPGISLSLQVMHLTLARLLHSFNLDTTSDAHAVVDLDDLLTVKNFESTPLEVFLTPRLPSKLY